MKKKLIALVICLYSLVIVYCIFAAVLQIVDDNRVVLIFSYLLLSIDAFALVLVGFNFAESYAMFKRPNLLSCQNSLGMVMNTKLVLVPFYIANYILWFLIAVVATVPMIFVMIGWAMWIGIFLASIFTYLTMLATSSYAIVLVNQLRRLGKISQLECLVHIILQLFFVLDVIDTVYLATKYKNQI